MTGWSSLKPGEAAAGHATAGDESKGRSIQTVGEGWRIPRWRSASVSHTCCFVTRTWAVKRAPVLALTNAITATRKVLQAQCSEDARPRQKETSERRSDEYYADAHKPAIFRCERQHRQVQVPVVPIKNASRSI